MYQLAEANQKRIYNALKRSLAHGQPTKVAWDRNMKAYSHDQWNLAVGFFDPSENEDRRKSFCITIEDRQGDDRHYFQVNPPLHGGHPDPERSCRAATARSTSYIQRTSTEKNPSPEAFRACSSDDRWIRIGNKDWYIVAPIVEDASTTLNWLRGALDDYLHAKTGIEPDRMILRSKGVGGTAGKERESLPLNTILFGPPGTGKTYGTTKRCVEICDGRAPKGRECRARYDELVKEKRVRFITFHQSYGYEEFVEGIRPRTDRGQISYGIEDGVLKEVAAAARRACARAALGDESHGKSFEVVWSHLHELAQQRPVVQTKSSGKEYVLAPARDGIVLEPKESGTERKYSKKDARKLWDSAYREDPRVATPRKMSEIFGTGRHGSFLWIVYNEMWRIGYGGDEQVVRPSTRPKNYVLVIDEINRANISKVMGELITLLEEDKREDAENEITVTLPYSRERFTLPKNLHILGTMNTADRSIALLDTALRRRFRFEEMSPKPEKLKKAAKRTGVDLPSVAAALNDHLEYLVDRDHLIGHAWFMDTQDRKDVDDVMRYKIIPLVAAYFYDDWSKVQAVLGGTDDFVKGEPLGLRPGRA